MTEPRNDSRAIRCPGCGGPSVYSIDNPSRPFCSARCKNSDFGAWASEGYAVAADPDPESLDSDSDPAEPTRRDPSGEGPLPH